jgi:hypothetical protein
MEISEVYSRAQNPQYWYIGRSEQKSSVFMEIFSKEASLTDVDNALSGTARRIMMP